MTNRKATGLKLAIIGLGVALAMPVNVKAQDAGAEEADSKKVNCIDLIRIKNSKVVDNQTIILYMRGKPDYQMNLAHRCPGLKMQKTWLHDAKSTSKLCSVDVIRVPVTSTGNILNTSYTPCIIESIVEYHPEDKGDG